MFEFGPVQHCLSLVQALQAGVLKVGAGYEKFGLGGKWLWHGTSLAKFGRTGNLVVMQRSQVKVSAPPSPRLELVICVKKLPRDPQASFGHNHSSDSF
jgi:hypothetical protein